MSICRWSSNGGQCDVYSYECEHGGFQTSVAEFRRPKRLPDIEYDSLESVQVSMKKLKAAQEAPDNQPIPIGGSLDGKHFSDETPEGLMATMRMIADHGYIVPEFVFEAVQELIDIDEG